MTHLNKALIKEWIDRADADYEAAASLNRSRKKIKIKFIIGFHCQQAVEKYLKALLLCYKIDFPKVHDLIKLLDLVKTKDPFLNGIKNELNILNPFAVWFRYPGEDIGLDELRKVVQITKRLREILQKRIKEFL